MQPHPNGRCKQPPSGTAHFQLQAAKADLPHQGSVKALSNWWQSLGDPLLVELIASAQAASPSVTAAASRIAQARSAVVNTGAASGPNLSAAANASRGISQLNVPLASLGNVGLQASWEIDLWGGNRAAQDAAQARLGQPSRLARSAGFCGCRGGEHVFESAHLRDVGQCRERRRHLAHRNIAFDGFAGQCWLYRPSQCLISPRQQRAKPKHADHAAHTVRHAGQGFGSVDHVQ